MIKLDCEVMMASRQNNELSFIHIQIRPEVVSRKLHVKKINKNTIVNYNSFSKGICMYINTEKV